MVVKLTKRKIRDFIQMCEFHKKDLINIIVHDKDLHNDIINLVKHVIGEKFNNFLLDVENPGSFDIVFAVLIFKNSKILYNLLHAL